MELQGLQRRHGEIRDLGATLFFVGPETEEDARKLLGKNETDIPVLSDIDGRGRWTRSAVSFELPESAEGGMYTRLGFPDRNPGTGWRLPVPATFVIDQSSVIRSRHCLSDYRYRMEPRDVVAAVEELQHER